MPKNLNITKSAGIINIKKFYALYQLKNLYKYLIVVDAEAVIIKNINLYKICSEFNKNKILLGNKHTNNSKGICAASKAFFSHFQKSKMLDEKFDELYLWFNQPCIYNCSYLNDFFEKTQIHKNYLSLSHASFDYYIYMYYLVLFKNFKVYDLKAPSGWGFLESGVFAPQTFDIFKVKFLMAPPMLYKFLNKEKIFMMIHLDRACAKNSSIKIPAIAYIKNHLSYKLGKAMIENSKSVFGRLKMPFVLWRIKKDHKLTQKINEILCLPKIETLSDYKEALKYKNHLSYKLGAAMIKATKTWYKGGFIKLIFEIQKIKKEHKKK